MNDLTLDMVGQDFGPVWPDLENNPEGAIAKLMEERNGEVPHAYRHPELGWIGFVYGNAQMGLAHIAQKRGAVFLSKLPQVLRKGRVVRDPKLPRVYIADSSSPANVAVIRLNWDSQDKTWVVTFYEDDQGRFKALDHVESAGQVRLSNEPPASTASRIPAVTRQENAITEPENVLDAVSSLERVKLSGELAGKVKELAGTQSALQRVKTAKQVADLLQRLGAGAQPSKIRNFGWDAVKLSDLSMEDLSTLREQVQAEHANPRDEKGGYLENGQPSLYLYDKKGRWKLDKLAWAVTYKLQEKRRQEEAPIAPKVIRAWHGVKRENLDFYVADGRVLAAPKFNEFSTDWKIEPGIWFSRDKSFAAKYGEPVEFLLTIKNPMRHEGPLKGVPREHDAVYRMHGKGDDIEQALEIAVFDPSQIELAEPIPDGAVKLGDESPKPQTAQQYPLYQNRTLYHGTALPFDSYSEGTRKGSGYDHQGKGFYLTSDKRGYARFFAIQAADRILNGPTEPEGEEARILEGGRRDPECHPRSERPNHRPDRKWRGPRLAGDGRQYHRGLKAARARARGRIRRRGLHRAKLARGLAGAERCGHRGALQRKQGRDLGL